MYLATSGASHCRVTRTRCRREIRPIGRGLGSPHPPTAPGCPARSGRAAGGTGVVADEVEDHVVTDRWVVTGVVEDVVTADRTGRARRSGVLHTPVTFARSTLPSCTAYVPTPPDAPLTSSDLPGLRGDRRRAGPAVRSFRPPRDGRGLLRTSRSRLVGHPPGRDARVLGERSPVRLGPHLVADGEPARSARRPRRPPRRAPSRRPAPEACAAGDRADQVRLADHRDPVGGVQRTPPAPGRARHPHRPAARRRPRTRAPRRPP